MEDSNPELESFRQQWRAEVTARTRGQPASSTATKHSKVSAAASGTVKLPKSAPPLSPTLDRTIEDDEEDLVSKTYHDLEQGGQRLGGGGENDLKASSKEPDSALEHYEEAVERETQGNLGDSLKHYRKAYRLDSKVDKTYKDKHFPSTAQPPKPANPNPSNTPATVPNTAHHSLEGSTTSLILSFGNLSIPAALPPTEYSPPPPAPLTTLPSEILVEILLNIAIYDVAIFSRLALVCRRLAYLVATEDRVWKRICEGPEVGFGAMHYSWACDLLGTALEEAAEEDPVLAFSEPIRRPTYRSIIPVSPYPSYALAFHHRPRIRFAGLYISTVNYIRPGASSPSQVSWNTPVHIVTYYRYLRFFRDGTVLSLLTTAEPIEVVHHLTPEFSSPPSSIVKGTLRGRWHLSGDPTSATDEGDVHVETEGVRTEGAEHKYMYKMHLSLRSAGRGGARNNKLVWRGFWSHNRLTDDWGEFSLRNDKAFFWSRVKSYGMG